MIKLVCCLAIFLNAAGALADEQRIVGGSLANIGQYPYLAALLFASNNVNFRQNCGGSIINNRSVMSAAHCWFARSTNQFRIRVGSSNANSGGTVHNVAQLITHPNYNSRTQDNDVGVVRVSTAFSFGTNVRVVGIANFDVADNVAVWVAGWGVPAQGSFPSEQLRHVQIVTINRNTCRARWNTLTDNMMCAGWAGGGRGPCSNDSGGPLVHNNVVIGVVSFATSVCGADAPAVFVRVSRVANWVRNNA